MHLKCITRYKLNLRSKECYDLKNRGPEVNNGGSTNLKNKYHKDFKDRELNLKEWDRKILRNNDWTDFKEIGIEINSTDIKNQKNKYHRYHKDWSFQTARIWRGKMVKISRSKKKNWTTNVKWMCETKVAMVRPRQNTICSTSGEKKNAVEFSRI